MSFDTLTIAGILSAILSGGFLIALASRNEVGRREDDPLIGDAAQAAESNS